MIPIILNTNKDYNFRLKLLLLTKYLKYTQYAYFLKKKTKE